MALNEDTLVQQTTADLRDVLGWRSEYGYNTEVLGPEGTFGRVVEHYLLQGKSWGAHGPKQVVRDIVAQLDRGSILREARGEILARLKR